MAKLNELQNSCKLPNTQDEMIINTARELTRGKAIGWMQGKWNLGLRSLGSRSILADQEIPRCKKI